MDNLYLNIVSVFYTKNFELVYADENGFLSDTKSLKINHNDTMFVFTVEKELTQLYIKNKKLYWHVFSTSIINDKEALKEKLQKITNLQL